jgi:hypothetical protein
LLVSRTPISTSEAGRLLAAVRDCWASLWTARAMADTGRARHRSGQRQPRCRGSADDRRRVRGGDVHRQPEQWAS